METYELVFVVLGTSVIFGLLGISIGQYLAHEEVKRYKRESREIKRILRGMTGKPND